MISRKMWLAAVLNWRSATAFSEFLLNDHLAITPQFLWFFEALPCTGLCGSDCLGTPNQRIKLLKYLGSDRSAAADEGTPRLSSRHTINFDTRLLTFHSSSRNFGNACSPRSAAATKARRARLSALTQFTAATESSPLG